MNRVRLVIAVAAIGLAAHTVWAQQPPASDGWVVLPLEEYRTLRTRAFPPSPPPDAPPVESTLSRIEYELRTAGETATGTASLTIDVLKQGWVAVQIPPGLLVREARLDGRLIPLVSATPPRVLLSRPGRSVLTLTVTMPVAASGGTENLTVPPSPSGVTSVSLVIPRRDVELSVDAGFVADQSETDNETRWTVYGRTGRPLTFTWKRRTDDRRATMPLRARARITELVALGEDSSVVTTSVRLEVAQGAAQEITLAVPDGMIVNQVSGATVADWTIQPGRLTISFLDPVIAETSVVVNAETRTPREGIVTVPILRMPDAERETGGVAVDVIGAGEISDPRVKGLEPADAADLGGIVAGRDSPSAVAFRFSPTPGTAPRGLTVAVARYSPQAVLVANVEEARYQTLVCEDGKTLVRARYAVRNNQRSFLAVNLPAGATLWSASLAGRPVRPGLAPGGGFLLPLEKGRTGEEAPTFVVELVYLQRGAPWSEKGDARLELPSLDLPVSRTGLALHHSPRFQIEARPGTFRLDNDRGPWSAALRTPESGVRATAPEAAAAPAPAKDAALADMKVLVDRLRNEAGRTTSGRFPIEVAFPRFGPSIFLAAELTAEARSPSVEITYKRTRR